MKYLLILIIALASFDGMGQTRPISVLVEKGEPDDTLVVVKLNSHQFIRVLLTYDSCSNKFKKMKYCAFSTEYPYSKRTVKAVWKDEDIKSEMELLEDHYMPTGTDASFMPSIYSEPKKGSKPRRLIDIQKYK